MQCSVIIILCKQTIHNVTVILFMYVTLSCLPFSISPIYVCHSPDIALS